MRQVILYPDPVAGGWVAEVPSLPGCVSEGETKPDALRNVRRCSLIREAARRWPSGGSQWSQEEVTRSAA